MTDAVIRLLLVEIEDPKWTSNVICFDSVLEKSEGYYIGLGRTANNETGLCSMYHFGRSRLKAVRYRAAQDAEGGGCNGKRPIVSQL